MLFFKIINKIARDQSRDQWAEKQHELELKRMQELEQLVLQQGPLLTRSELGEALIVDGLLKDDASLDRFINNVWQQCDFALPISALWERNPDLPMDEFLLRLETMLVERIKQIMQQHPQRLTRFEEFTHGFIDRLKLKMQERKHYFMERWSILQTQIMLQHDMGLHYEKSLWLNALKSCLYTEIFMHFATGNVTMEQQFMSLTIGLSLDEHAKAAETRQGLQIQIKELQEHILPLLAPKDEFEDSDG